MSSVITQGIVLRRTDWREHDRILTLLTPRHGRIDVLSRGCRRPKSPLMPASELFVNGEYTLFQNHEHYTLTGCSLEDTFYPLRMDPYRLTCASYMAALCAEGAQPGQEAVSLYALLLRSLYHLAYDQDKDALGVTTCFLLQFADACGYRPRLKYCTHCGALLNLEKGAVWDAGGGGLCCDGCAPAGAPRMSRDEIVWMSRTLRENEQNDTGTVRLFEELRRYVELRMEKSVRVSRLLP